MFCSDLTEYHVTNSALALVDGEPWPIHQALTHSCSLTLLTFKDDNPTLVNEVPQQPNAISQVQLRDRGLKTWKPLCSSE